jgi:hypothetical protein
MPRILNDLELSRVLAGRPERTETYEVERTARGQGAHDRSQSMREMDGEETAELAQYLGISTSELHGPFWVAQAVCSNCGRRTTFLDFAKSGVDSGAHSVEQLASILTSRDRAWITVVGTDGGRRVACANCGDDLEPDINDGYHSGAYDYEFP